MSVTTNDHRVDIIEYADELCDEIRTAIDDDTIWEYFLDISVYRKDGNSESYKVEFLITCGGPHVEVTVNELGYAELSHSWGKTSDGKDRTTSDFNCAGRELWQSLAEQCGEMV